MGDLKGKGEEGESTVGSQSSAGDGDRKGKGESLSKVESQSQPCACNRKGKRERAEGPTVGSLSTIPYFYELGIPEVQEIFTAQKFGLPERNLYPRRTIILPEENNTVKKDRISQLSNDILEFIISLLPMKEGAVTCLFSRRWRNLWRTSASFLDLRASTIFGDQYPRDMFREKSTNILYKEGRSFTRRVNKLLKSRSALRLKALRLCFPLDNESTSHIDRWLNLAITQKITELNLKFNYPDFRLPYSTTEAYEFSTQLFTQNHDSSLKYLRLENCNFEHPPNFKGFNLLVSLDIENMRLTHSDVENILSNCYSLESLSLKIYIQNRKLKFSNPSSPVLKHISCHGWNAKEVEIQDINILSFEIDFQYPNSVLSIKNVPNLTRLHLSGCPRIEVVCDITPSLEILLFSFRNWDNDWFKLFEFNNLKQLVLNLSMWGSKINLSDVIYVVEACPLLQKLELNMGTSIETIENLDKIKARPRVHHHNLKKVDIYGFEGHSTIIEFMRYLFRNAIVLEKMKISRKQKFCFINGLWCQRERRQGETKEEGISIVEVHQLLQKEVRLPTELVILSDG